MYLSARIYQTINDAGIQKKRTCMQAKAQGPLEQTRTKWGIGGINNLWKDEGESRLSKGREFKMMTVKRPLHIKITKLSFIVYLLYS